MRAVIAALVFIAACGTLSSPSPFEPNPPKKPQAGGSTTGSSSSSSSGGASSGGTTGTSTGGTTGSGSGTSTGSGATTGSGTSGGSTGSTFDPRTWIPDAKGLWIWRFDQLDMTAEQAASEAQSLGIGWVLIKSGQDDYWNTRYTPAVVESFTSRGMHVFAWPYITPSNPAASIAGAVAAAEVAGTDGLVLDVEVEFQGTTASQYAAAAQQICDGIRDGAPGVFLGYTSFGWVDDHATFPYATFDSHCGDAFFPQVYWSDFGVSASTGYTHAVNALNKAKLLAPVWMVQSNDSGTNGIPTATELNSFFSLAGPRTSLWALTDTTTTQYKTLATLDWGNGASSPNSLPNNAFLAADEPPTLSTDPPAPIDQSSPESVFADQLSLLHTHVVDDAVVDAFQKSVVVPIDRDALVACAARVSGNKLSPDWEMAKRSEKRALVSIFGKSYTAFSAGADQRYKSETLWCR